MKRRYINFLSMTFIVFVSLDLNVLLCWHDFRDVNVMLSKNILGVRPSLFCGCLVNLTI